MKRILLSGYFGFNNLGDEAILASMVDMIREEADDVEIIVLTDRPEETKVKYNTETIYRYDIFKIAAKMRQSDIFISGGGSLLQDVTSLRSVPYYLGLIWLAQFFNLKTVFFAQGVGPVKNGFYRFLIKLVLNRVDYLSVRDLKSELFLEEIGINRNKVELIDDPVYGYNICEEPVQKTDRIKRIGVSVRNWQDNSYLEVLADFLNYLIKKEEFAITIVPFHEGEDVRISKKLKEMLYTRAEITDYTDDLNEINQLYNSFDLFIGVRLHSLIFAAVNCVPFIGISYDPKVESLIKEMNYQPTITTKNINQTQLITAYDRIKDERKEIEARINRIVKTKNERVKGSISRIMSGLKGE